VDHLAQPVTRCPRADGGPANDFQNIRPTSFFVTRAATLDAANAVRVRDELETVEGVGEAGGGAVAAAKHSFADPGSRANIRPRMSRHPTGARHDQRLTENWLERE
jgi:hypothetical protein